MSYTGSGYNSQQYPPQGSYGQYGPQGQYPPQGQYGPQGQYPPQGSYGQYGPQGQYPPQGSYGQYPPQGQYPPHGHFPHHHGGYGPSYPPQQPAYAQAQTFTQGSPLPDSAHEHGLVYEQSADTCKVCHRPIAGQAYVCHDCPLVLCYDCANAIFYGNKQKQVHPHPLMLRLRPAWKCDICKQRYRGTASFYCQGCDFDACSLCYVGF